MDDNTRPGDATNEQALDPNESWGQGTDASHPIPAQDTLPNEVGTDPALADDQLTDEVDDPPLT